MKRSRVTLACLAFVLLIGCVPPGSQYQTIAWQPDGSGWTQYKTNDPSARGYAYTELVSGASLPASGTVTVGIRQLSGSVQTGLGVVFGYASDHSYWVFYIDQAGAGAYDVFRWNGLSWQYIVGSMTSVPIVLGADVENDLSIGYDGTNIAVSVNGTLQYNINSTTMQYAIGTPPLVTGLSGTGIGYVVMLDSSETFPAVPLDARFKLF